MAVRRIETVYEVTSPDGEFKDMYFDTYDDLLAYLQEVGDNGTMPFVIDRAFKVVDDGR